MNVPASTRTIPCVLCGCLLLAKCVAGELWTSKNDRKYMSIEMDENCRKTFKIPDDIDDLRIRYSAHSISVSTKAKCQIYIQSRAFEFVDQSFTITVRAGLTGLNCITFGKSTDHGVIESTNPRIPNEICKESDVRKFYVYSSPDVFSLKVERHIPLYFSINMNMHGRANDWQPFSTDPGRGFERPFPVVYVDMKEYCGKMLTISRGSNPINIYYKQQHYGAGNCSMKINNRNTPFDRLALQVLEFHEFDGFCIRTKNIGAHPGVTFCNDNPPNVYLTYISPGQRRDFEITINGSGSAFMNFGLLLYTFHGGECYNGVCRNNRCLPEAYKCRPFNPCGDYSECPKVEKKLAEHLTIFCIVFTAAVAFLEFCCHVCNRRSSSDASGMSMQQRTMTQSVSESRVQERVQPSAPMLDIVTDSAVTPTIPGLDLPPSYDEVVANPNKYGGPDS